jgi:MOSC domain-containing protein YiiM
LQDSLKKIFFAQERNVDEGKVMDLPLPKYVSKEDRVGKVIRLAARAYDKESSKPSSRSYTTKKSNASSIQITKEGVIGDYNHYRTMALDSTKDRAVSILTQDVMKSLRATYKHYGTKDGDLGENILVDNVPFDYFQVGKKYQFKNPDGSPETRNVLVEITEPMEACANLCKLPYINDDSVKPLDRITRCKDFIDFLNRFDGYRGWYTKVLSEGEIKTGAIVSLYEDGEEE